MTPERNLAADRAYLEQSYTDEAGRPIGEFEPSALSRLSKLHGETIETARLANILGRTRRTAFTLSGAAAIVIGMSAGRVPPSSLALWAAFVAAASVSLLRLAHQAERSEFELPALRAFALDLNAIALFAGFAWGGGAFLCLPAAAGLAGLVLFCLLGVLALGPVLQVRS